MNIGEAFAMKFYDETFGKMKNPFISVIGMEKLQLKVNLVLNHYLNCIRRYWSLMKKVRQLKLSERRIINIV